MSTNCITLAILVPATGLEPARVSRFKRAGSAVPRDPRRRIGGSGWIRTNGALTALPGSGRVPSASRPRFLELVPGDGIEPPPYRV